MSDEKETMVVNDIYLAAYLSLAGCKLVRRYREGRRVQFEFSNPAGSIRALRDAFYSNEAMVPAFRYSQEIIGKKQQLFDP